MQINTETQNTHTESAKVKHCSGGQRYSLPLLKNNLLPLFLNESDSINFDISKYFRQLQVFQTQAVST